MKTIKKAIMYTDGSAHPNNTNCTYPNTGSGMHGYIYSEDNLGKKRNDRPSTAFVTDKGYLDDGMVLAFPDHKLLVPDCYVTGYSSFKRIGTNNTAEIQAFVATVDYFIRAKEGDVNLVDELLVLTDSLYVINIVKKIKEDTAKSWNMTVEKNLDLWGEIDRVLELAKQKNLVVNIDKVLGHSNNVGNELADDLALLARLKSTKYQKDETVWKVSDIKNFWKPVAKRHPFLSYSNIYFMNQLAPGMDNLIYSVLRFKTDTEAGKKTPASGYGLVVLAKPDETLNVVRKAFLDNLGSLSLVSVIDTDVLESFRSNLMLSNFGEDVLTYQGRGRKEMKVLEEDTLCREVYPPGLAKKSLDKNILLLSYIEDLKNEVSHSHTEVMDITSTYFSIDPKGKYKYLIGTGVDHLLIKTKTQAGDEITIPIVFGIDIMDRNSMKKLEPLKPTVLLLKVSVSEECIEYYVVIKTEQGDYSIWCNFYSNKVYVL